MTVFVKNKRLMKRPGDAVSTYILCA